ncbi:MAG: FG-GAP-like repeat-containing protein [bacterium]|nr:FG-GAP-like repeat-containing protein [bacterium]
MIRRSKILASVLAMMVMVGSSLPFAYAEEQVKENASTTISDEYLSRGVVAIRNKKNIFISWRTLISDTPETTFNVYRSVDDGEYRKINTSPLTGGSNYTDKTADVTKTNTYYITSVNDGVESEASTSYTLEANAINGPVTVVPINEGTAIRNVWVGDFNGDGDYDYLVSRYKEEHQLLEAYLNDGTYLWTINLGHNSENKYNISPGSTTIDVGHWDGATVYDMNNDGKAEVLLKIANGVTFGDGEKFTYSNDTNQWFAVIDGMSGSCMDKAEIPDDYIERGSLGAQVGVGYLDGEKPSLVAVMKNRNKDKSFNLIIAAYSYTDNEFKMDWQWNRGKSKNSDGHQFRIADVDYDGKDEILEIGFCLNGDGTLRYSLHDQGIVHGDRFYVGKFNKDDEVMMGYGIQQNNPSGLQEYYYNASTGEVIWKHMSDIIGDVGRGSVGDIDPTQPGLEVWSFSGIFNANSNKLLSNAGKTLWPAISLQWDGDLLSESYMRGVINQWNVLTNSSQRVLSCYKIHSTVDDGNFVISYGDIFGDWREEIIATNNQYNELVIYTTNIETEYRIPSLVQDRTYRNCLTVKGYKQSHMTGFYLGADRTDYSDELSSR